MGYKRARSHLTTKKSLQSSLMMIGMARAAMNAQQFMDALQDIEMINSNQYRTITQAISAIRTHIAFRNHNKPIINETHLDILIDHLQNAINDI